MVKRKPAPTKRPARKTTAPKASSTTAALETAVESRVEMTTDAEPAAAPQVQVVATPDHEPKHETNETAAHSHAKGQRKLDVFLIDSGWNNPICTAVRENIPAVASYLKGQRFFVMSQEQSLDFIQRHPPLMGADPVLLVIDPVAAAKKDSAGFGFRLALGHVKNPEVAISMLKWAMQLTMTASMSEMATLVRKSGHRETFQGIVELVGESAHLLEFAPI